MDDDTQPYAVVLNDEEQYSIWPADRDLPPGWRDDGFSGLKADCLAHIDEVWTDMRPLSLRRAMEEQAFSAAGAGGLGGSSPLDSTAAGAGGLGGSSPLDSSAAGAGGLGGSSPLDSSAAGAGGLGGSSPLDGTAGS